VGTTDAGPIDLAASVDGSTLYSEDGAAGAVDELHVNADGSLSPLGSVAGLNVGIEGTAPTDGRRELPGDPAQLSGDPPRDGSPVQAPRVGRPGFPRG
jgi:hypothetical protein